MTINLTTGFSTTRIAASVLLTLAAICIHAQPVPVEVVALEGGYTLVRDGKPYFVRGAGVAGVSLETLAKRGGNSVRTWGIEDAQSTLDEAEKHSLTVAMGLPVAAERFGFDYDDPESKAEQRENVRAAVLKYKDHPALLAWIIGNELDMSFTNHRVYDEINQLSRMIHELDPNHVTTTTITAMDREIVELVREKAPDLDFVSIQAYGALALMPKAITYLGEGPFMVTEWGPLGHWEVGKTRWGAAIEPTSTEKARHFLRQYRDLILPYLGPGLGSYAFLWGHKQERTQTWFSLFTESGATTGAVDALELAWTGRLPANQAPVLESVSLARRSASDSVRLTSGRNYVAKVVASDTENDDLSYQWSVKPESDATTIGGDLETSIADIPNAFDGASDEATVRLIAPGPGHYRVFVEVHDGHGHAAHGNIPFMVIGKKR